MDTAEQAHAALELRTGMRVDLNRSGQEGQGRRSNNPETHSHVSRTDPVLGGRTSLPA